MVKVIEGRANCWDKLKGEHGAWRTGMRRQILPYNPKLKDRARQLRRRMTRCEVLLWQRLKRKQMMGYDFDRQRPIGNFIVDFYCKDLKLAIEVDGSVHDSPEAQAYDRRRQAVLESQGVCFLRFRNQQVEQNLTLVCHQIRDWIVEYRSKISDEN